MRTDHDRAELSLLRTMLALRTGDAPELATAAMHHLLVATGAVLGRLELHGRDGRFERTATTNGLDVEQIRAHVVPAIVADARARDAPVVTAHGGRSVACVPITEPDADGHVYLLSRGVFTTRDLALIIDVTREVGEVAQLLIGGLHDLRARTRAFEWRCVRDTLERCRGNVSEAARILGVPRSFLYRLRARDRRVTVSE